MTKPIPTNEIEDVRKALRDANMMAAKSTGFRRWMALKFAAFFSWAYDLAHEINHDIERGKDDNYHDEY